MRDDEKGAVFKSRWPRKSIAELASHRLGKMLDKAKNLGAPQPYLRNLNVRWFGFDLSDLLEMRFLPEEAERYSVRKGDLLICEGGYPGRAAIWEGDEPAYFQKALHRVRFHEPAHAKWCLYYLLSEDLSNRLRANFNGTGIQHFTGEALARFRLPVPSLSETHRIVALLDEAFEGIATAKANAEKSLLNARELFGCNLSEVFSAKDRLVPLSELASDITDGDHMPPPKSNAGIPFITISNIVKRTRAINFDSTFLVSPDYFASLKANRKPRRGDVLYTVTGATLGIPVRVDHDTEFCFQRHIALIRPRRGVSSEWLSYAMASPQVFAQATQGATGAAQKTVSLTLLRSMKVPRHSESEQASIVAHLDKLFGQTQSLEDLYGARLTLLNELKNSLLHQAFSGAL